MLLAIDIGTTNMKAGLFREDGSRSRRRSGPMRRPRVRAGRSHTTPSACGTRSPDSPRRLAAGGAPSVRAVGITSMAESGLLLDPRGGKARSPVMPWFEACSIPQAELVRREIDAFGHFRRTGLHASFKHGLPKLLWLRERLPESFGGSVWLSVSAYIAYRLTGKIAEDETLAAPYVRVPHRSPRVGRARSFAISGWGRSCSRRSCLRAASSETAGRTWRQAGLGTATAVGLPGHDHIAASLACSSGGDEVYDSMGTAETLVGAFAERGLDQADFESGLSFGRHAFPGRMFWMGAFVLGRLLEWLRGAIGDGKLSYADIMNLLERSEPGPTGIVYFPYLSGSGAPRIDPSARAAFIGLTAKHGKGELIKAVLEGNAYQLELMRRSAERVAGHPIERMNVVGGGAKNGVWLQIKADVSGIVLTASDAAEATLLGAALTAGVGTGVYGSFGEAAGAVRRPGAKRYVPDAERHAGYGRIYERGFLALMEPSDGVLHRPIRRAHALKAGARSRLRAFFRLAWQVTTLID